MLNDQLIIKNQFSGNEGVPMPGLKNKLLAMLYTIILGAITGAIVWAFLKVMNLGTNFLWTYLPGKFSFPLYTVVVCTAGSLLIGFYKSKTGDYPEELSTVMGTLKKNGRYPYNNILIVLGAALFPLLIGAAIGPEAGLTGVIAGLCCWVGDKLKRFYKEADELASIGASATLATIFRSPMFGFVEPLEGEADKKLPKASKTVLYILAILSSLLCFFGLGKLAGGTAGFPSISFGKIEPQQYLWAILLVAAGTLMGFIFILFEKLSHFLLGLVKNVVIRCVIGGIALGCIGTLLPLTMFSGEHQIEGVLEKGTSIGSAMLIIVAVAKLFLTNVCIASGLKGGHFFPVIFSGIAAGFAISMIIGIDPGFCMAVVTAALLGSTLRKPVAVTLLLLILFPVSLVPFTLGASALGSFLDITKLFPKKKEEK